jgi:hypothetical protein
MCYFCWFLYPFKLFCFFPSLFSRCTEQELEPNTLSNDRLFGHLPIVPLLLVLNYIKLFKSLILSPNTEQELESNLGSHDLLFNVLPIVPLLLSFVLFISFLFAKLLQKATSNEAISIPLRAFKNAFLVPTAIKLSWL